MVIRKLWRSWASNNTIGVALIALAILSGVTTYFQAVKTDRVSACVASYTEGFSKAIDIRTESQSRFNDSLDRLMFAVSTASTPDDVRQALTDYVKASNARREDLKRNPYPDPVSCNQQ